MEVPSTANPGGLPPQQAVPVAEPQQVETGGRDQAIEGTGNNRNWCTRITECINHILGLHRDDAPPHIELTAMGNNNNQPAQGYIAEATAISGSDADEGTDDEALSPAPRISFSHFFEDAEGNIIEATDAQRDLGIVEEDPDEPTDARPAFRPQDTGRILPVQTALTLLSSDGESS